MNARLLKTTDGAILFDDDMLTDLSPAAFTAAAWAECRPVSGPPRSTGRGHTMIVGDHRGEFVLRHFVRGGLIGRIVSDRYFWLGEQATRAFREWHLLSKLASMDLPVPRPAGARYVRTGLTYKADLLTVRIPDIVSLSHRIALTPFPGTFWTILGRQIADFHNKGVYHADLNAYNVQVDKNDRLWLVDFDRGSLRRPGPWQQRSLGRLLRSLRKVKRLESASHFSDSNWTEFLEGYASASRSA